VRVECAQLRLPIRLEIAGLHPKANRNALGLTILIGFWFIWIVMIPSVASAQEGSRGGIRGQVQDADFFVPLPGVQIGIEGFPGTGVTDSAGNYFINDVPPGQYVVLATKEGYLRARSGTFVVNPGVVAQTDLSMTGEVVELDEFTVSTEDLLEEDVAVQTLDLQSDMKSFAIVLGAQFIAQTGASDVAKLLAKQTGVNVSDGKFVVVRGLADRYNSVTLNGLRVPSSDPDRRAVALDLFPSSVIKDVRTSKTFLPELPGESTGATINVVTKSVPEEDFFKIKVGNGYNTQATQNSEFLSYRGGGTGMLGTLDDRRLPGYIQNNLALNDLGFGGVPEDTPEERALRQNINQTLSNEMGTKNKTAPIDFSFEMAAGKRTEFMGRPAGVTVAVDYSKKYSYSDLDRFGRYVFEGNSGSPNLGEVLFPTRIVVPESELQDDFQAAINAGAFPANRLPAVQAARYGLFTGRETMRAGMLVAAGIELDTDSEIVATYFFNRVAEDTASYQLGWDPQVAPTSKYRETLQYVERQLRVFQLAGNHAIDGADADFDVDWAMSYNQSSQYEPDLRLIATDFDPTALESGFYNVPTGGIPPFQRYWRQFDDQAYNARLDVETDLFGDQLPEEMEAKMKFGGLLDYSDREYRADSFAYNAGFFDNSGYPNFAKAATQPPSTWGDQFLLNNRDLTTNAFIGQGTYLFRQNDPEVYDAGQVISAAYWQADVDMGQDLNIVFGARVESTDLDVKASPAWIYPEALQRDSLIPPSIRSDPAQFSEYQLLLAQAQSDTDPNSAAARADPRIVALSETSIQDVSLLPALSVNWDFTEKQRVRASIARTIARPSFKEIAPVSFQIIESGDFFVGNKELQMSQIMNYDTRWELSPTPGSLFAASLFAKEIRNAIEFNQIGNITQFINVPQASVYGFELEAQTDLSIVEETLKPWSIGANYTFISSKAIRPNESVFGNQRRLQGQPDYIFNFNLTYDNPDLRWTGGLFLNVVGPQLFAVSQLFEEPDIFQRPFTTLDAALGYELWDGAKLSFRAQNLADAELLRYYDNRGQPVHSSRKVGITYSVSLTLEW
jgi:outer membrane receptor protein involved in Fe transport